MKVIQFDDVQLDQTWSADDADLRTRDSYVMYWGDGSTTTAAVLFEVEQGGHLGRHIHTADETIVVLEGDAEFHLGEEKTRITAQGMVVAPALEPHNIYNVGSGRVRCLGIFPSGTVHTIYDDTLMPGNKRLVGTPAPSLNGA